MNTPACVLQVVLRVVGTSSVCAPIFVAAPYTWMNVIHQWLGPGPLPDAPVVGYLARSTSAFYAMRGGLLWMLSFDLRRHRPVLAYLGIVTILFGLTLLVVDLSEGLPRFWSLCEGPLDTALGIVILWLSRRVSPPEARSS